MQQTQLTAKSNTCHFHTNKFIQDSFILKPNWSFKNGNVAQNLQFCRACAAAVSFACRFVSDMSQLCAFSNAAAGSTYIL